MRKWETHKYYFSVEAPTEVLYLKWLENMILESEEAQSQVKIIARVESPMKMVKKLNTWKVNEIVHTFDFEEIQNEGSFKHTLDHMKKAEKTKHIQYRLGYSNFCFELWMILYKKYVNRHFNHRREYLDLINECFGTTFESLDKYKKEANFLKVLSMLSLEYVKKAIKNAERIMRNNQIDYQSIAYKGFRYYRENPSLTFHEHIRKILKEAGII